MNKKLTQWHPAFCSAMKLEFGAYKNKLEFFEEHGLNSKPKKLIKRLVDIGMIIEKKSEGIYYVKGAFEFSTQFIVLNELEREEHIWLRSLTREIDEATAKEIVNEANLLSKKDDKEFADSFLQVVVDENSEMFDRIKKGGRNMCEAIKELMRPEWEEMKALALSEGHAEGRAEGEFSIICKMIKAGFGKKDVLRIYDEKDYERALESVANEKRFSGNLKN